MTNSLAVLLLAALALILSVLMIWFIVRRRDRKRRKAQVTAERQLVASRREQALAALNRQDYAAATVLFRELCSGSHRLRSDFRYRAKIRSDRGMVQVLERYRRYLNGLIGTGRAKSSELALRLWSIGDYDAATEVLSSDPKVLGKKTTDELMNLCRDGKLRDEIAALRKNIAEARSTEDLIYLRKNLRILCKRSTSTANDFRVRIDTMHRLGLSNRVRRYSSFLRGIQTRNDSEREKVAERLWACGEFTAALEFMPQKPSPSGLQTAVKSLIACGRFSEADALLQESKLPNLEFLVASEISRMARDRGISPEPGKHMTPAIVSRWLSELSGAVKPTYEPIDRSVMLYSHSMGIGGAERQTRYILDALCAEEDVSAVTLLLKIQETNASYVVNRYSEKLQIRDLTAIDTTSLSLGDRVETASEVSRFSRALGLTWLPYLISAIQDIRPEVVHVRGGLHGEVALAAVLAGVPRVVVHFGSMSRGQQSNEMESAEIRVQLIENIIAQCAAFPNVVLSANSRAAADDWAAECGLPKERLEVIYNAIDVEELGLDPEQAKPTRTAPPYTIGGVFRIAYVKDPKLWVEVAGKVAAKMPDTKFLIVGDGPMRAEMETMVAAAGLTDRFEMAGFVTDGLNDYLRRMDVFLLTTRTEGLPNVVIEAQLAGLPVVAPDVGGTSEATANEATARLTSRDANEIADAVMSFVQCAELRESTARIAPTIIAERFSPKALVRILRSAYGWRTS